MNEEYGNMVSPVAADSTAAHIGNAVDGLCGISKHAEEVRRASEETVKLVAKTVNKIVGNSPVGQADQRDVSKESCADKDYCLLNVIHNQTDSLNHSLAAIMANLTAIRAEIVRL